MKGCEKNSRLADPGKARLCSTKTVVTDCFIKGSHKKASLFRILSKRGGFSPSLTFFWTLNGGRREGDDHVTKLLRPKGKYFNFGPIQK